MIWLCIAALLSATSAVFGQDVDTSRIRVFPADNRSIAGVFQVSFLNEHNQPQYAFNASDARRLCVSLGTNIASRAQVWRALKRGLETCRFGWIDEHFAIIPRITALSNCGKSQTGLVAWRASVTKKFDVFCFNESDAATQLDDTTTASPLNSSDYSGQTSSTQATHPAASSSLHPSSSSAANTVDAEAEPARYVGSSQSFAGAKVVLITSACAVLLIAIITVVYLKLRRICNPDSDKDPQQEYVETQDWSCVKSAKPKKAERHCDEKIDVEGNAS